MKELKNAYSQGFANRGFNRKSARDQHDHNWLSYSYKHNKFTKPITTT
jgi:hypothetical protein